ncbi:MAG: GAF domain-containing protein, partial [Planctomycetota bacterium]|nr:GAF domain-containing protein [Planctomycetota bacterium]
MSPKNGIGGDAYDRRRLHDLLTRSGRLLGAAEAPVQDVAGMPDHSSLERLLELGRRMNRIHDRNELLAYIRDRLSELFDAENSVVILVGRDGSLRVMDSRRDGGREISETLVRRVIDERRPTLVRDATQDPELQTKESVLELGLVSILGAPLIVEGEVIGVIEFDQRTQPQRFSEADLTLR